MKRRAFLKAIAGAVAAVVAAPFAARAVSKDVHWYPLKRVRVDEIDALVLDKSVREHDWKTFPASFVMDPVAGKATMYVGNGKDKLFVQSCEVNSFFNGSFIIRPVEGK